MKRRFGYAAMAVLAGIGMTALTVPAAGASGTDSTPQTDEPAAHAVNAARAALNQHAGAAHLSGADSFKVLRVLSDNDGASHVRMRRVYHGIPVIGGQVIVHNGPNGTFKGVTTAIDDQLNISTTPTVSTASATHAAKKLFRGQLSGVSEPRLVVDVSSQPRLAWEVVMNGVRSDGQTPSELHVVIDAHTADVVATWNTVQSSQGRGNGVYNGQVTFQTTRSGGTYKMVDAQHGNGTTRNADRGNQVYTDSDNVWSDGAAVDVHFGVGKTYDYFAAKHSFAGPAGNGSGIPRNVHVNQESYCNAFYNGSSINFGDCNGNPFTGIDIAAHEYSHGVTDNTAGLRYSNGDSGGLNEATSDIFGTLVEFYANSPGDPPDYKMGETIGDVFNREALRYMYKPTLNPNQFGCYAPGRTGNPHFTSGVANHFFYLLVQGSNPANYPASPTCDGSTVDGGIGNAKGGQIWFRALSRYMGPSETYPQAAEATAQAAADLYGVCGPEYRQVQKAWAAVSITGIGQQCVAPRKAGARGR